jgi:hypothetical protein
VLVAEEVDSSLSTAVVQVALDEDPEEGTLSSID